ncbi:MAG: right-handed parallel beta-helix repeat-containing protein [Acidimicrobiales bacterium]
MAVIVGAMVLVGVLSACGERASDGAEPVLVVDSTGDGRDRDPSDGRCADADGRCTLRAAIETANGAGGAVEVRFDLPAGADGAVIRPQRALPVARRTIVIDGTTQPGSRPNRAPAPRPFDGVLRVRLDGSDAGADASGLVVAGPSSVVRGLVVSGFDDAGIVVEGDGSSVEGCYIGTDADGARDAGNRGAGVTGRGARLALGGSTPDRRNVISGNDDAGAYPASGWVVQGNYIGVAADGSTALGNGVPGVEGSGALSIDDAAGVLVGGDAPDEANVISANASYGVAPYVVEDLRIAGNLVGVAADGRTPLGNGASGIQLSHGTGVEIVGNTVMYNRLHGILVASSTETTVGGTDRGDANVVSANLPNNISVWSQEEPNEGVEVMGNLVGTAPDGSIDPSLSNEVGISIGGRSLDTVVGGEAAGAPNRISGGSGPPIAVLELRASGYDTVLTPERTAVLGNEILGGDPQGPFLDGGAAPIDLAIATDTSSPIDLIFDRYDGAGRSAFDVVPDAGFGDVAPPSLVASARRAAIRVAGDPEARFRIELFAVDEGATCASLIGSATARGGEQVEIDLDALAVQRGFVAASATQVIDGPVAFGSTSELSPPTPVP